MLCNLESKMPRLSANPAIRASLSLRHVFQVRYQYHNRNGWVKLLHRSPTGTLHKISDTGGGPPTSLADNTVLGRGTTYGVIMWCRNGDLCHCDDSESEIQKTNRSEPKEPLLEILFE